MSGVSKMSKILELEARLDILEERIFGKTDKDKSFPKEDGQVIDTLVALDAQLSAMIAGKPRIESVMKKLRDIECYLDPVVSERLALSNEAKIEVILAEEKFIRQHIENLQKVQDMLDVLNSEHIKAVSNLEGKLQKLNTSVIEQEVSTGVFSEEVKRLCSHYNNTITLVSKMLVGWDSIVTNLELAARLKDTGN